MFRHHEGQKYRLFRVSYTHKLPDAEAGEEYFHIGIYSTRDIAERAVAELVKQPGFKDDPEGFIIDEEVVDDTSWQEGFVTESTRNDSQND